MRPITTPSTKSILMSFKRRLFLFFACSATAYYCCSNNSFYACYLLYQSLVCRVLQSFVRKWLNWLMFYVHCKCNRPQRSFTWICARRLLQYSAFIASTPYFNNSTVSCTALHWHLQHRSGFMESTLPTPLMPTSGHRLNGNRRTNSPCIMRLVLTLTLVYWPIPLDANRDWPTAN